jgi:hypothetical protein
MIARHIEITDSFLSPYQDMSFSFLHVKEMIKVLYELSHPSNPTGAAAGMPGFIHTMEHQNCAKYVKNARTEAFLIWLRF